MLHLYQSNRLETLLELLAAVIAIPQERPLATETVIVQSKGMGRWISLRLADKHGICANIDFPLPASFLWRLLCDVLGELPARSDFAPELLVWRIMDWLAEPAHLERAPRVKQYLAHGGDLRRFELAARVADVFDQYLLYRMDWLAGWERGVTLDLGPDEDWQMPLWRALIAGSAEPHRAALIERMLKTIAAGEFPPSHALPERLILFGISSLPPYFLQVIEALARHIDVALFALNPCREAWGDIRDHREIAALAGDRDADELYLDIGNPLLASLGGQGREFFDSLSAEQPQVHGLFDDVAPATLLGRIQADVLNLSAPGEGAPVSADDSLQVHVCHGAMREVEVLRDQLLAMLQRDRDLEPSDIAVLTPDIASYAPYIDAVFGIRDGGTAIPYGIADRSLADETRLPGSFVELLNLPQSRFEAEWVLDFLELPAIRRRFGLADADLPLIHDWVRRVGIRWGRDAEHRRSLGLPAEARHSWRDGLNRLLLGYALPAELAVDGLPLFADTLPDDDVEGSLAQTLGRFAGFVEALIEQNRHLQAPRPPTQWADAFGALLDALYDVDGEDEENARQHLLDAFELLRDLGIQAGFTADIGLDVAKRWLATQLDAADGGGGFLTGGVTFAAMVPMRSLPFKVICLLGMNDGALPRQQPPAGFDLIARHPRRGDRSRRQDDRYLFLETLLSARQTLYISYVGRGIRDNGKLPPSVLVSELLDIVKATAGADAIDEIVTEHPLQPFNPAYFVADPHRPGFSPLWLAAAKTLAGVDQQPGPAPFFGEPLPPPEPEWLNVDPASLASFCQNPARYLLRRRLGIVLEEGDAPFEHREPFALDYFARDRLREIALEERRHHRAEHTALRIAQACGALPHGGFGRALFRSEQKTAEQIAGMLLPLLDRPVLDPVPIDFRAGELNLSGFLTGVTDRGLLSYKLRAAGPRELFDLWLKHLLLCLLKPAGVALNSRLIGLDKSYDFGLVDDPEPELQKLLHYYRQGLMAPLPLFVKSGWAYVGAGDPAAGLKAARKVWEAPEFRVTNHYGESENPYYQTVYNGINPLDAEFETVASELLGPMYAALREEA